ncbi:MAG: response regulator [Chloroflexota bacterium]
MPKTSRKQTILIIDDNITNLKVVMEYLQAYSFEILVARNGADGLESAELATPDLILLDVQMPGLDGFEVCRRLKANPETAVIPVIFMTALTDANDKVQGLEAGAVDYVTKPIESKELLARVNTHLELQALQKELQDNNEVLEEKVEERTAVLQEEIRRREKEEAEKAQLAKTMTQQSEHLRNLTQLFLENQQKQQLGLTQTFQEQIVQKLKLLQTNLLLTQNVLNHTEPTEYDAQLAIEQLNQAHALLDKLLNQTEQVATTLDQASNESKTLLENPLMSLSVREREVLQYLSAGKTRSEIAEMLIITPGTVSTYRARIMEKLNVEDNASLMKLVVEHQLHN